jgi:hypothetical protein
VPYFYDKLIPVPPGVNTQQFKNIQKYRDHQGEYHRKWRQRNKANC